MQRPRSENQYIEFTSEAVKAAAFANSEGGEITPIYPDRVFRELIVNACVHRNYSISGANIRVFLFDDRLEVISPGRLPNTVSIDKLPIGTSFARNPVIMRFMENLGYVDKLGRGLPMVCQEAKKVGRQAQFLETGEEFRVILPVLPAI